MERPPKLNNVDRSGPSLEGGQNNEQKIERRKGLAMELFESGEVFKFPGINDEAYAALQEADKLAPPGYVTPIDELIQKLESEGMKIMKGIEIVSLDNPASITCVAPASSGGGFYGEDLLHIKNLHITPDMDPRLVELIELSRV